MYHSLPLLAILALTTHAWQDGAEQYQLLRHHHHGHHTSTSTYSEVTAATAAPTASALTVNHGRQYIEYSTVTGYFLQDLNTTNATSFDYTAVNFGLINQTYPTDRHGDKHKTQWQRFHRFMHSLNKKAPRHTEYKLLFIGRHGEGYHNAAQSYYGTAAWNCYYAELDGNSTVTWADAHLTATGIQQALIANAFWAHEMKVQHIKPPQSFYVSPLSRCLQTAQYTYSNLSLPADHPFVPTVKEYFREGISIHTCDRRSNRTYIASSFPTYHIEPTLSEYDEEWNGITAESSTAQLYRSYYVLDSVFSTDPASIISITTHSGEAASMLSAIGHIPFSLNTGAIIPVLVKAETKKAPAPATSTQAWAQSSWCANGPPVTSQTVAPYACVCSGGQPPIATTATVTQVPASATAV